MDVGYALLAQGFGQHGSAHRTGVPDVDVLDVAHGAHGRRQQCRDAASAHHEESPGILACQKVGAQGSGAGRAACGDGVTVDEGQRHAGGGAVQHVGGVQAGQSLGTVPGEDVDGLHAEEALFVPGGHDECGAVHALALDGVGVAQRHGGALGKGIAQCGDQCAKGQGSPALFGIELFHGGGNGMWIGSAGVSCPTGVHGGGRGPVDPRRAQEGFRGSAAPNRATDR